MEKYSRRLFVEKSVKKAGQLAAAATLLKSNSYTASPDFIHKTTVNSLPDLSANRNQSCEFTGNVWEGVCTYYSHDGCIGCSADQIMANGEYFREWDMTIAFMRTPLNTNVLIENLESGLSVTARVTDRGGFERYGILADLSLGVAQAIQLEPMYSPIRISQIVC